MLNQETVKQNQKLIDFAAKAIGLSKGGYIENNPSPRQRWESRHLLNRSDIYYVDGSLRVWNPLENDGDAMMLVYGLELNLRHDYDVCHGKYVEASQTSSRITYPSWLDQHQSKAASIRSAITQVAAEIGRRKNG
jgi:hypothetical protein